MCLLGLGTLCLEDFLPLKQLSQKTFLFFLGAKGKSNRFLHSEQVALKVFLFFSLKPTILDFSLKGFFSFGLFLEKHFSQKTGLSFLG